MEKVTNVAEICNLIRNKLIEYGVQEHTAWYDYSQNYRPIVFQPIRKKPLLQKKSFIPGSSIILT